MKTPDYLQVISETVCARQNLKIFPQINWKKLSSLAFIRLLAIFAATSILTLASSAQAILKRGDSGSQVITLQKNLNAAGYYYGPITGFFGTLTEDAVIRFQRANRLLADGIVREDTEIALQRQVEQLPTQTTKTTNFPQTRRIIKRGDSGADVEELQKKLQAAGYYEGPITGFYGTLTEAAVKRFQKNQGLYPYGIADLSTQNLLRDLTVTNLPPNLDKDKIARRTLRRGDRGKDVEDLQKRLQELGYYQGEIDGVFGQLTEAAVICFQQDVGLIAEGVADEITLLALEQTDISDRHFSDIDKGSLPARRYSVLELQKRLKQRGFYSGPLDNQFNFLTRQAVVSAQRYYGVSSNDILAGRF
ncbi:MAG: peptidoglycan-binding protein [Oscillatoriaceae bacterium SKW80]|nr:peptidoglycan-binding protein [Oscillatoriaceae bacterium SKYG93]MCX8120453.1 peptidoglycan-binding protein [Oscillatoriaceae bacterium SKW80]MDW8452972.1 peptidoglycan-binding protein [Oscillatoriaceae cyanobacterium SKYGB_i_bin93]HIK28569.1 peptidoglycan-binding protein [Oscillatoriaceae cyanobacterium M7585_C2015_266]